jgi:hypothetical protein
MGQILRYETKLPELPEDLAAENLERFFVTGIIPAVRQAFADHGFAKKARFERRWEGGFAEEGQDLGGLFIVGVAGQIFEVRQDFQLARPSEPYSAVGAGAAIALGALHASASCTTLTPRDRAERALEAAEAYCSGVRRPFHFVRVGFPESVSANPERR